MSQRHIKIKDFGYVMATHVRRSVIANEVKQSHSLSYVEEIASHALAMTRPGKQSS
jgi:hypothetical protein